MRRPTQAELSPSMIKEHLSSLGPFFFLFPLPFFTCTVQPTCSRIKCMVLISCVHGTHYCKKYSWILRNISYIEYIKFQELILKVSARKTVSTSQHNWVSLYFPIIFVGLLSTCQAIAVCKVVDSKSKIS